jgi:hypothetical protein
LKKNVQKVDTCGYFKKHRLIALQWIPNPTNLPEVDHINCIRSDYRIENLRWVSSGENSINKSSYQGYDSVYLDSIPDDAIVVNDYSGHQLRDIYFHDDKFFMFNGVKYRELYINEDQDGYLFVHAHDIDHKRIHIHYSKFKRQYDLL